MILINEQQIRLRIPASQNVEMTLLRPNILLYQETRLMEIMGYSFYTDIVNKYTNQTLNAAELLLLNEIHPVIAFGGLHLALPFIWGQISNRGVIQQSGDFTSPASDLSLRLIRESISQSVSHYEARLIKYLELNRTTFPLWTYISTDLVQPELQNPNDFGMILDHFGDCGCSTCKKN